MTKEYAIECVQSFIDTFEICKENHEPIATSINGEDVIAFKMAIKALEQEPCEDWYDVPSYEMTLEQARQAVRDLRKMWVEHLPSVSTEKTGWIPVSERLPEEKQVVLVWCPEYKNIYCAYLEYKKWWIFGAFSQIIPNAVIAWMPLPKPYRAESEVEE